MTFVQPPQRPEGQSPGGQPPHGQYPQPYPPQAAPAPPGRVVDVTMSIVLLVLALVVILPLVGFVAWGIGFGLRQASLGR